MSCHNRRRNFKSAALADGWSRSGTELLAAAGAPRREYLAAAFGRHPAAKAVAALAHQFARLIGPFHGICLRCARPDPPVSRGPSIRVKSLIVRDWRGLYESPPGPSIRAVLRPLSPQNREKKRLGTSKWSRSGRGNSSWCDISPDGFDPVSGASHHGMAALSGFCPRQRGLCE
jgi:hypothetical protein